MIRRLVALPALALALWLQGFAPARAATEIQRVVSPGGVEAWLVEERAIPMIALRIAFRGGASLDSAEKAGRARLFAGLLEEGAGPYDAPAFAEKAQDLAARFGFEADADGVSVSASMLLDAREDSLELLRLALVEPRFEPEAVARVKAQVISGIKQDEVDPEAIASRAWFAAAFPDDAYGRRSSGTVETVSALTPDDLRAAHPIYLDRSELVIGVVGAVSAEELGPILDRLLGGLPDPERPPLPEAAFAAPTGVRVEPFDAPQSTVLFGQSGILRADSDFIPAYVMNYVLGGGGFSSRLTEEVREKRGLAYGVYSYLAPLDRAGLTLGGVATANASVAESIALIRAEWARMRDEGVTDAELDEAKRYLTGAYPLSFDTNGKIAAFLVSAQLDDLGIDYRDRRNALVEAVTRDDIARVARRLLDPEALFFVVVGKPEGL